jgi:hypothetical protein
MTAAQLIMLPCNYGHILFPEQIPIGCIMDNFRKGLHSHAEADAKTGLCVFTIELKHYIMLSYLVQFLGPVIKSYLVLF